MTFPRNLIIVTIVNLVLGIVFLPVLDHVEHLFVFFVLLSLVSAAVITLLNPGKNLN